MKFVNALQLRLPARIAFIGAGGKTTAMFELARQLPHPVIVTTTTHLGKNQLEVADIHFEIDSPDQIESALQKLAGVNVFTGPSLDPTRASALQSECFERLWQAAYRLSISILVEADGARGLPLKAPADHEPVVPDWIETTVVVAGLSAIGKPLSSEFVHRPEIYGEIGHIQINDTITNQTVASVLLSEYGGLKGIPAGSQRVALLNQADSEDLQSRGYSIAEQLLGPYSKVLVSSLKPPSIHEAGSSQPGQEERIFAAFTRIGAIILAAGGSKRLGEPKQLLAWKGESFIRHVARSAVRAGFSPVIVVTGAIIDEIEQALNGLPVMIQHNPDWEKGQSTSIRTGLKSLPDHCGGVVFMLADQPQIPVTLLSQLASSHHQTLAPVIAPLVDGRRANPVLFDRITFKDLMGLTGDVGGRAIFSKYHVSYVPWHDSSILIDVDLREDYERLVKP